MQEGGGGGAPATSAVGPLQSMLRTTLGQRQHCSPQRSVLQSRWIFPGKNNSHDESMLEQILLKDHSWWRTHVAVGLSWRRGPILEQDNSLRKERQIAMNWMQCPFSIHPALLGNDEVAESKKWKGEDKPGEKNMSKGRCSCNLFFLVFLLPNLTVNKLN